MPQRPGHHSITLSACSSGVGGIVRPSAFAVFFPALLTGVDSTVVSGSAPGRAPVPRARRSPSCRPATG